jgi:hypothetical protein
MERGYAAATVGLPSYTSGAPTMYLDSQRVHHVHYHDPRFTTMNMYQSGHGQAHLALRGSHLHPSAASFYPPPLRPQVVPIQPTGSLRNRTPVLPRPGLVNVPTNATGRRPVGETINNAQRRRVNQAAPNYAPDPGPAGTAARVRHHSTTLEAGHMQQRPALPTAVPRSPGVARYNGQDINVRLPTAPAGVAGPSALVPEKIETNNGQQQNASSGAAAPPVPISNGIQNNVVQQQEASDDTTTSPAPSPTAELQQPSDNHSNLLGRTTRLPNVSNAGLRRLPPAIQTANTQVITEGASTDTAGQEPSTAASDPSTTIAGPTDNNVGPSMIINANPSLPTPSPIYMNPGRNWVPSSAAFTADTQSRFWSATESGTLQQEALPSLETPPQLSNWLGFPTRVNAPPALVTGLDELRELRTPQTRNPNPARKADTSRVRRNTRRSKQRSAAYREQMFEARENVLRLIDDGDDEGYRTENHEWGKGSESDDGEESDEDEDEHVELADFFKSGRGDDGYNGGGNGITV